MRVPATSISSRRSEFRNPRYDVYGWIECKSCNSSPQAHLFDLIALELSLSAIVSAGTVGIWHTSGRRMRSPLLKWGTREILILAHLGTGGGGAIGLIFRCGEGTMDAARRSAASLAGDGTPGPPELNFLQLISISISYSVHPISWFYWIPPVLKRGRLLLCL